MTLPHYEVPSGAIDGVNLIFNVSVPYLPGTTAVFLNGLLLRPDYTDGWTESDPATGEITLKEPPRVTKITPDVVQVFFLDTAPDVLDAVIVCRLRGRLRDVTGLEGRLVDSEPLRATVEGSDPLRGHLVPAPALHGTLEDLEPLHGRLEMVC